MSAMPSVDPVRTMVVIEQGDKRHVMEIAAEATLTYDNPNDPWASPWTPVQPIVRRLELDGVILRHVIVDLDYQGDPFDEQPAINQLLPELSEAE